MRKGTKVICCETRRVCSLLEDTLAVSSPVSRDKWYKLRFPEKCNILLNAGQKINLPIINHEYTLVNDQWTLQRGAQPTRMRNGKLGKFAFLSTLLDFPREFGETVELIDELGLRHNKETPFEAEVDLNGAKPDFNTEFIYESVQVLTFTIQRKGSKPV